VHRGRTADHRDRGRVTDASVNLEAADRAEETFEALNVAVLNAGVRGTADLETDSMDVFDRSIAVNLRAVVLGLRAWVPIDLATSDIQVNAVLSGPIRTGMLG
jgi:NAD(P)-dependent dehydrogenase (short-subunit alcohol dehydrogenase family)